MQINISILDYLKNKLGWVKDRKHKLALLENRLRSMRALAVEIKDNSEQMK